MNPIRVPKIVDSFSNGAYSMTLEHGLPLGLALHTMSRREALHVADTIGTFITRSLQGANDSVINNQLLLTKLDNLLLFYESARDRHLGILGVGCVSILQKFFSTNCPVSSFNHGDLSFENLLVSKGGKVLTALDFLDSPTDSILIDIGRFWLDLKYGWWGDGLHSVANSSINAKDITLRLESLLESLQVGKSEIYIWTCFAALRMAPYTKNPVRLALLKSVLLHTVEVYG